VLVSQKGIGIVVFQLKKSADLKQDIIFFPRDIIGMCVSELGVLFFSSVNEVIAIDLTKKKYNPTFLFRYYSFPQFCLIVLTV
jgi:hypothetical protein